MTKQITEEEFNVLRRFVLANGVLHKRRVKARYDEIWGPRTHKLKEITEKRVCYGRGTPVYIREDADTPGYSVVLMVNNVVALIRAYGVQDEWEREGVIALPEDVIGKEWPAQALDYSSVPDSVAVAVMSECTRLVDGELHIRSGMDSAVSLTEVLPSGSLITIKKFNGPTHCFLDTDLIYFLENGRFPWEEEINWDD